MGTHVEAPRWSVEALGAERTAAVELFRQQRLEEPLELYNHVYSDAEADFERLLAGSHELQGLGSEHLLNPRLFNALRYLMGPPVSLDDLLVVVDATSLAPRTLQADPELAARVLTTIVTNIDRRRFPWVQEGRAPSELERRAAIVASAALMATQRVATQRRSEGKDTQEEQVRAALRSVGFAPVPTRKVASIADAPRPGEFCDECEFGSRKADILVGLWDRRVLPIECKVSNSATNSIKRLNNDAAIKAETWRKEFGELQVVPTAVLGGVYNLRNLESAQGRGLTLFWAHRLEQMTDWISRTRRTLPPG